MILTNFSMNSGNRIAMYCGHLLAVFFTLIIAACQQSGNSREAEYQDVKISNAADFLSPKTFCQSAATHAEKDSLNDSWVALESALNAMIRISAPELSDVLTFYPVGYTRSVDSWRIRPLLAGIPLAGNDLPVSSMPDKLTPGIQQMINGLQGTTPEAFIISAELATAIAKAADKKRYSNYELLNNCQAHWLTTNSVTGHKLQSLWIINLALGTTGRMLWIDATSGEILKNLPLNQSH